MVTAIDTNIAVEFFRKNEKIIEKVSSYKIIYLPVTVVGELVFGALNSAKKEEKLLNRVRF